MVTADKNDGGGGDLFGLAIKPGAHAVYFVDDFGADNNLQLLFERSRRSRPRIAGPTAIRSGA